MAAPRISMHHVVITSTNPKLQGKLDTWVDDRALKEILAAIRDFQARNVGRISRTPQLTPKTF